MQREICNLRILSARPKSEAWKFSKRKTRSNFATSDNRRASVYRGQRKKHLIDSEQNPWMTTRLARVCDATRTSPREKERRHEGHTWSEDDREAEPQAEIP